MRESARHKERGGGAATAAPAPASFIRIITALDTLDENVGIQCQSFWAGKDSLIKWGFVTD